jgi:DNA-binding transcriptional ArsR family regulator
MAARSIKDVIASGKLKTFIDRRLVEAIGHPLRQHVLAVLNERVASTSEIGREIDLEVSSFYHHVELLENLGFLELVESRKRRGANERFLQAKEAVLFDDEAWEKVPPSVRSDMAGSHVLLILDELAKTLRSRAFGASSATHSSWLPGVFDKLGWQECLQLMNEMLVKMMEIKKRSAKRLAASGEPGIPATIAMMGFATAANFSARRRSL